MKSSGKHQAGYLEVEEFYRFREDQRELVHETRLQKSGEDGADDVQLLVTSGRNLRKVTKQDEDKGRLSFFSCMNLFLFSIAVRFGESSSPTILVGRPLPLC